MPLDKNPESVFSATVGPILERNSLNCILYTEPLVKASFLARLIRASGTPIHYVDTDLLYSGLVSSGILRGEGRTHVYRPDGAQLRETLGTVLGRLCHERVAVIIDSLNGLYGMLDGADGGRLINSYIMLLGLAARTTRSQIIIAGMARERDGAHVLSPTGRQIIISDFMTKICLRSGNPGITLDVLGGAGDSVSIS